MNINITMCRLIIVLTCTIIFSKPASALELKQAVDGPSYEDTVKFILSEGFGGTCYGVKATEKDTVKSIDDCMMTIEHSYYAGWDSKTEYSVKKINVKAAESVGYKQHPAENGAPICTAITLSGNSFYFGFGPTIAEIERLVRALNHLRKLCGAKESLF